MPPIIALLLNASVLSPVRAELEPDWPLIGKIKPRHAREITASNWSVGAETMDRDFTIYRHWREYLGPLGCKKARIQSGWAKTERERGKYDWAWMDEIVPDMVAQGVEPWVCLCYGNPVYPGGGDTGLGGALVSSPEALAAWDRYVDAFVDRYARYVDEWEIWNEPRTGRGEGAVQYAEFVARTAQVIRARQPHAEILFAAGASFDTEFARQVLVWLRDQGKLGLVNAVIYHPYAANPDSSYPKVAELREIARSFAPHIGIRQGENGCPSAEGSFGALSGHPWTAVAQAKWALRRLLGDLGRDIPSSYFSICDMHYHSRLNTKGLLETNPDKTVRRPKVAYGAVQHLTAVFGDSVERVRDFECSIAGAAAASRFSVFGYRRRGGGTLVTIWRASDIPDQRPDVERVSVTLEAGEFTQPVWVDLLSGQVHRLPEKAWRRGGAKWVFTNLPVYDSVVVLADRGAVPLSAE